ncbi:hypothetical protein GCM10009629_47890 [Pseudonocardia alni]
MFRSDRAVGEGLGERRWIRVDPVAGDQEMRRELPSGVEAGAGGGQGEVLHRAQQVRGVTEPLRSTRPRVANSAVSATRDADPRVDPLLDGHDRDEGRSSSSVCHSSSTRPTALDHVRY